MTGSLLAWAFGAGVLAAINPCGFAILPGFVTHYLSPGASRGRDAVHGLGVGMAVTAGKLTVFAAVAAVFLAGGRAVVRVAPWAGAAVGVALVGAGLATIAGRSLPIRLPAIRAPGGTGYRSAYLFGLGYGSCSLACCLPIFLGVFLGIGGGLVGTVGGSAVLFVVYGAGVAAVLVPLFVLTGAAREGVVRRLRRLSRFTHRAAGVLLTLSGVLLVATWGPALAGDGDIGPLVGVVLDWQAWAQRLVVGMGPATWATVGALALLVVGVSLVRGRRRTRAAGPEPSAGQADDRAGGGDGRVRAVHGVAEGERQHGQDAHAQEQAR